MNHARKSFKPFGARFFYFIGFVLKPCMDCLSNLATIRIRSLHAPMGREGTETELCFILPKSEPVAPISGGSRGESDCLGLGCNHGEIKTRYHPKPLVSD